MNLRNTIAALLITLAPVAFAEYSCPERDKVFYPLDEIIKTEGLALEFDFSSTSNPDYGSPEHVAQNRETVLRNLEGKSQAEKDALLLGRLAWSTQGTIPLLGITTLTDAGLFDHYLDVLNRRGLMEQATALRKVKAAFPLWNTTAQKRYYQWSDGSGAILNRALDATLRKQSTIFQSARPSLLDAADRILQSDPSYPLYLAKREEVSDWHLHTHLMGMIGACLDRYDTPDEALAALGKIDPVLADFHLVDLFLLEAGNGGMHQYFYNSTGMLAPQLAATLASWDLPEHANAVIDAMAYYPAPYPADTQRRREIMYGFDEATDEAVNAGTWISDDGATWDKVKQIAIAEGYWPQ